MPKRSHQSDDQTAGDHPDHETVDDESVEEDDVEDEEVGDDDAEAEEEEDMDQVSRVSDDTSVMLIYLHPYVGRKSLWTLRRFQPMK